MRKYAIFPMLLVLLIAGCVSKQSHRMLSVELDDEWLKPFQTTGATIMFYNTGNGIYRDAKISLIDDGILDAKCSGSSDKLRPGDVLIGYCSIRSGEITGDGIIKYAVTFSSSLETMLNDIEIISEDEWVRRQYKGGKRKHISSMVDDGNVRISASLEDPVPLEENHGTVMKITISNIGNGFIQKLSGNELYIEDPYNIIKRCYSMKKTGNRFVLAEDLPPIRNNFQEIDCFLKPRVSQVLNIYNVKIHLDYNYKIMDTFEVRVVK